MTGERIVFAAPQWLVPVIVLGVLAAAAVWWSYRRAGGGSGKWVASILLKLVGILLLALCLLEPMWQSTRAIPGANLFVILADNSRSLQIRDGDEDQPRGSAVQQSLNLDATWQTNLVSNFNLRRFLFDARPRTVKSFDELSFDGKQSALLESLTAVADRYHRQPVAGILLVTDGNSTEPGSGTSRLAGVEFDSSRMPPVYPVVVGGESRIRDLRIENVAVNQTNFEAAPVTIRVQLAAHQLGDSTVVVDLLDQAGKTVVTEDVAVTDSGPLVARLQVRPEETGTNFYTVRARTKSEHEQLGEEGQTTVEATLENNESLVAVNRAKGPYRILYVSGRPNWEFKFLRRALEEDAEVDLVGLIRIAKREAKFDFRRRGSERTNPLFTGFDAEEEQAEQYFEPVLIRSGAEPDELPSGFPTAPDQLFRYDALVLDDVEAEFFTRDQMSLIHRFVSERGGGLLMLGGQESFAQGDYDRTPIGELLPVYLDSVQAVGDPPPVYQLDLSKEGWLEPWVRLRKTENEEKSRLARMTHFSTLNISGRIKPGAMELAHVRLTDGKNCPALVAQSFGKGRSAALLVGDFWSWGLARNDPQDEDMFKAWRQTLRWLIAEVPRRVEVDAVRDSQGALQLRVDARDEEYDALDNAQVEIEIVDPGGHEIALSTEASDQQAGQYVASFAPRDAGPYLATVRVQASDGSEVGEAQVGWTSQPDAEEFSRVEPNREFLEAIAQRTGGQLVELDQLDTFAKELPHKKVPLSEPSLRPLWHRGWLFMLAIACFCGEWGIRRWKGLP